MVLNEMKEIVMNNINAAIEILLGDDCQDLISERIESAKRLINSGNERRIAGGTKDLYFWSLPLSVESDLNEELLSVCNSKALALIHENSNKCGLIQTTPVENMISALNGIKITGNDYSTAQLKAFKLL